MMVILMVFYIYGELVLSGVGPILGNGQKQPLEVFCKKKVFLEIAQSSQENTCNREAFSYGFCEISEKTFFPEHLWATASKWVLNLGGIAPGKGNISKVAIQ